MGPSPLLNMALIDENKNQKIKTNIEYRNFFILKPLFKNSSFKSYFIVNYPAKNKTGADFSGDFNIRGHANIMRFCTVSKF